MAVGSDIGAAVLRVLKSDIRLGGRPVFPFAWNPELFVR
jgi:hypothetical protein